MPYPNLNTVNVSMQLKKIMHHAKGPRRWQCSLLMNSYHSFDVGIAQRPIRITLNFNKLCSGGTQRMYFKKKLLQSTAKQTRTKAVVPNKRCRLESEDHSNCSKTSGVIFFMVEAILFVEHGCLVSVWLLDKTHLILRIPKY